MGDSGIMILDFSGKALTQGESEAGFEAAILYLRQERFGPERFRHPGAEGVIQSVASYVWAGISGELFAISFDKVDGVDRNVSFLLPSACNDVPVPDDAVDFLGRLWETGRSKRKKETVH